MDSDSHERLQLQRFSRTLGLRRWKTQWGMMKALSSALFIFHLILYHGFGRHLPASATPAGFLWRRVRYWICRPLFAHCGRNVNVESGASIGMRTVSIGSNSGIGVRASVGSGTKIGSDVMMGPDVLIVTRNHAKSRVDIPMVQQGFGSCAPVTIGNDVWIGARVIILPGVTVGAGSILGAGAVISRDVPPWAVVVGNPQRVV